MRILRIHPWEHSRSLSQSRISDVCASFGGKGMTYNQDFDTLIERIKADRKGTLIVICGRVGCGKTTLALRLMSSINGSEGESFIVTQSDLIRLDTCRSVPDARAHIAEDILSSKSAERICGLATIGYIPIVTVPDLCYIPRQYRGPSKEGLSSVLVIKFGGQRGAFKAIHSVLVGGRLSTVEMSGIVTQEDVDRVRGMAEKWRYVKDDKQWVYDRDYSRIL